MRRAGWFATALLSLAAASAAAGSFSVAPTRVEFDAGRRTAVISLRNTDAEPLTVQASMVGWTQPDGTDVYAPTQDLLATPPVFTVPPNGEQIVRIALRRAPDASQELAYRIFFQEVPQPNRVAAANTLNIALRVGVPVFLHARQPEEGMYLEWSLRPVEGGGHELIAHNTGRTHVQLTGFQLLPGGEAAPVPLSAIRYVLPGSRVTWPVTLPPNATLGGVRVEGHSDMGEFAADVAAASP